VNSSWLLCLFEKPRRLLILIAGYAFCGLVLADPSLQERAKSLRADAIAYENGISTTKDPAKAIQLYCEAARLGDVEAQYNIGWMYAMGRGIPRDDATAAYFFTMAAKQGDQLAKRMLLQVGEPVSKAPACLFDADGQDIVENAPLEQRKVMGLVQKLAPEYGIYPRLAMAIIRAESNFNVTAVSQKNAQGLMQLIPETAARFNVRKPFDPEQNIRGGLAYLRWLLAYFHGNITLVAAAYNAGEKAVDRYRGVPPYPETQGYVKRIHEIFKRDEHPFDPNATEPSPELPHFAAPRRLLL